LIIIYIIYRLIIIMGYDCIDIMIKIS